MYICTLLIKNFFRELLYCDCHLRSGKATAGRNSSSSVHKYQISLLNISGGLEKRKLLVVIQRFPDKQPQQQR